MEYLDILRTIAVLILIGFLSLVIYEKFAFSYIDPTRRYRYQRKIGGHFETRGSSRFLLPAQRYITNLPCYHGGPHRRIVDSKNGRVLWDSERD